MAVIDIPDWWKDWLIQLSMIMFHGCDKPTTVRGHEHQNSGQIPDPCVEMIMVRWFIKDQTTGHMSSRQVRITPGDEKEPYVWGI